jgi:hypothetical protein
VIAVMVVLLPLLLLCVVVEHLSRYGAHTRADKPEPGDDDDGGGNQRRRPTRPPDTGGGEPSWWPDFEREFADYVRHREAVAAPPAPWPADAPMSAVPHRG